MLETCPQCKFPVPVTQNGQIEYTENTIFAEGGNDKMLISSLVGVRNLTIKYLTIEAHGGYTSILSNLEKIKGNSGFTKIKKLLVVADANSAGVQKRFNEIISKLDKNEFSIPSKIGQLSNPDLGKKQCGIFLFPDNTNNGIIEDLCLKALAHPNKISCVDEHIKCIKNKKLLTTRSSDISKSKFHIYMSTSKKPT